MIGIWYSGTRYLFSHNIQSDIISIHNDAGDVVARYTYDAYGNHQVLTSSGALDTNQSSIGNINPFRYRGYYYDVETGLYYLNSRYYDPRIGRFISPDIMSILDETMMDANGLNLYMYCGNNPVMRVDPTGQFFLTFILLGLVYRAISGIGLQVAASLVSYALMAIAAIWNEDVRNDMNRIRWNPFNTDELIASNSTAVSFYKGVPIFRTPADKRSGSFLAIFLSKYDTNDPNTVKHEWGHNVQQALIGPLTFLPMIGLPSWKGWSKRAYYDRPWDITADMFGGVSRDVKDKVRTGNRSSADEERGLWYLLCSAVFGPLAYLFILGEY